ncbi:hypothetical protein GCM10029964_009460 [Kibdelosporangium lantanae]
MPVLTGNTRDEGRLTGAFTNTPYDTLITSAYGRDAGRVAAQYPTKDRLTWSTLLTDQVWTCNQLKDATQLSRRTPVFHYEFADRDAPRGSSRSRRTSRAARSTRPNCPTCSTWPRSPPPSPRTSNSWRTP